MIVLYSKVGKMVFSKVCDNRRKRAEEKVMSNPFDFNAYDQQRERDVRVDAARAQNAQLIGEMTGKVAQVTVRGAKTAVRKAVYLVGIFGLTILTLFNLMFVIGLFAVPDTSTKDFTSTVLIIVLGTQSLYIWGYAKLGKKLIGK